MTIETRRFTFEITRSHLYWKALGWEGLVDFTGTVGSSVNRC
jgi:hypothetical protein